LLLGGMTLVLVLIILPRRYVLNAGLREAGISFPSEAAPFSPPPELLREAPPPPPPPPPAPSEAPRGPAELFWAGVGPLLASGSYAEALPLFEEYLGTYPDDEGVLREFGITLSRAQQPERAAEVLERLLPDDRYPGVRLLLARILRDQGRLDEAAGHYASLVEEKPGDVGMVLEWARALAWDKDYQGAAGVLGRALEEEGAPPELEVELAQVLYWSGRLEEAAERLGRMDEELVSRLGAGGLKEDVLAALTPPATPEEAGEAPPATLLHRAALAFAQEDYQGAAGLYRQALQENPADMETWRAYADLLQYALDDPEGARDALLRLEDLGGGDPALHFRLARLEVWTGRDHQAITRLESLLEDADLERLSGEPGDTARPGTLPRELGDTAGPGALPEGAVAAAGLGPTETAEVWALLGDLHRWGGRRVPAGQAYRAALETDGGNERAGMGMDVLGLEVERGILAEESPRAGGSVYSFSDSDEFSRVDLGAEAVRVNGIWAWAVKTGSRWLGGMDLGGGQREEQGWFLELEAARWWRLGTVRTGVHLGVEQVRPDATDIAYGASLRLAQLWGFRTDLRYDHGPAYPITTTLQSVFAKVVQDRLTASMARRLGEEWSLHLAAEGSLLGADGALIHAHGVPLDTEGRPGSGGPEAGRSGGDRSLRLEGGLSLGRSITETLTLGVTARALTYTGASPAVEELRLFWDPKALFSGGLFAQVEKDLTDSWTLRARVSPSLAFIDERAQRGFQRVPHLAAEAGFSYVGRNLGADVGAFYYQGRFDGYNAYGLRMGLSARSGLWRRRAP
jgi:tetratricopeptide (TPR) repeat protein